MNVNGYLIGSFIFLMSFYIHDFCFSSSVDPLLPALLGKDESIALSMHMKKLQNRELICLFS